MTVCEKHRRGVMADELTCREAAKRLGVHEEAA
ncbi:hypothetical protein BH24ACT15_BH24ACT15_29990 [soil metagenome]